MDAKIKRLKNYKISTKQRAHSFKRYKIKKTLS
jgi:hypothetical protein